MHERQKYVYVGVDLHKEKHVAVVIDCWSTRLATITIDNKPSAFPELLKQISRITKKELTPVFGLEDTGGYGRSLAMFLVEEKQIVKEVNSALSFLARRSYPTTQKNDDWDAYCVATILLNRFNELPDANPQDIFWTIGQLVTRRSAIVKSLTSLKNQLHMQLSHSYPSYKLFFSEINGRTALAFWDEYPSPYLLKGATLDELTKFLLTASKNSCSTRKAEDILTLVSKDGDTKREYQEQRDFLIKSLVRDIRFKQSEIDRVNEELEKMMKALGYHLETMPGIDTVSASQLVAEIGDIWRFSSADKLARFAGIAPVIMGSGGKTKNYKSKQGNRKLHGIFYFLAVQQVQISKGSSKKPRNPVFYEYYKAKIKDGKTKGQALVCVMRRLVNILYGMMKNKTEYKMPLLSDGQAV
jgi:transposase